MIFKIERFAVPTVNWWTVTGVHVFLYFFFSRMSQATTECFPKTGTKTELPSFVSYFIYDDYNVPYTNGNYWLLKDIYLRFFSCLGFLLYYLRFFACILCLSA